MYRRRLLIGSNVRPASYIAPTAKSLTYNTFSQALINAGSTNDGVIEYSIDNSTWSETIPSGTNAGSYSVYWRLVGDTAHTSIPSTSLGPIQIAKATPTLTAPTAKVLTYNGSAQELVNAGSTDFGTLQYKVTNESWSTTIPTRTRGGSYVVQYRVLGDSNINDIPAESINCSINEKQVTAVVTLSQNEYTYNGSGCEPSVTVKDGTTVIDPSEYTITYSNNINVGTATVTINDNTGGDYSVIGSATFTIVKVTPTVTAPTAKVLTYNGSAQELVNAGSTDFGTLQYSLDDITYSASIPTGADAASYTVYYKVVGDSNINDVAAQSINISINKANGRVDILPTAKNLAYNGSAQELITAGSGTGTMMYKLDEGSWDTTIPSGTNATSYTVYYKSSATTNYNESSSGSVNCTISKADSSLSFATTSITINVGETATNAAIVNAGDGIVTYSSNNTSAITVDNNGTITGVGIGDVIITANISATNNYNSASTSYTASSILIMTTTYNATSTSSPTKLLDNLSDSSNYFSKQYIDGVEQTSLRTGYTFSTTGVHTVEYSLKTLTAGGLFTFYECHDLKSVVIPSGVANTGSYTFCRSSGLTSVTIPDTVTEIKFNAFERCTSLTNVNIPSGVTSIGKEAFYYCKSITSIDIPSGVTTIEDSTFSNCTSLTNVSIPSGVTSIGKYAFNECKGLTSVIIPDSVISIGQNAFSSCSVLTSVNIPSGVTSIEASTFDYCYKLTNIDIPSGVTSIGDRAFRACSGLTSVVIPDAVTSIGNAAFLGCDNLRNITIPNNVANIGDGAFEECFKLSGVTIGSGVTSIGDSAFTNCYNLSSITVDSNNATYDSRNNCNAIIETNTNTLVLGCKNTVIPNTVTSIGNKAFYGNIDSGMVNISIPNSVTSIGVSAFEECDGISTVVIPDSVTSIGNAAFYHCGYLSSCTIGDSVTSIGNSAFGWCERLKRVNSNRTGVFILPDSVTSIGDSAFYDCIQLEDITIGSGTTSIGSGVFYSCRVSSIKSNATIAPTIQSGTFQDVKTNGTLTVPIGSNGYDTWMQNTSYYLGYYNWTKVEQ